MQDFGRAFLGATPSYALNIAEVADGMGVDLRELSLRYAACGAEPWTRGDAARHRGETRHQGDGHLRPVRDHRPGRRQRMPSGAGRAAHLGGPLPLRGDRSGHRSSRCAPGESGELVLTTLTKEALPMIRYRTRDITRLHGGALRLRPHPPAHDARHRPHRRHADHPRRQRLSVAGRGPPGRLSRGSRRTIRSCSPRTARWRP